MKRKIEEKLKAIKLRRKGFSLNEIVKKVSVAKSSVSTWVRNVPLTESARQRLLTQIAKGQLISAEGKRARTQAILDGHFQAAKELINSYQFNNAISRIICSLVYWCEGRKNHYQGVSFTNSDPSLVRTFVCLLKNDFGAEEKRFRARLHLHEYHNPKKQLLFWSRITGIPKKQFQKSFLKSHTGKRIRENYPGCIAINYHSTDIARQLLMTAKAFFSKYENAPEN